MNTDNKHRFFFKLFFLFFFSSFISAAQSDSLKPALTNTQSILKDRLILSCPGEMRNEPRPHSLMSNPPDPGQETRLIYDSGKKRLVIFAEEMNSLSTPNLLQDIKNLYAPEERADYLFYEGMSADNMKEVFTVPLKHDTTKDAIMISSVIIQTKDSTLIQLGAYLNPTAFRELQASRELAQQIFLTLRSGNRKLDYHARKESVPLFGKLSSLSFPCPEKFITSTQEGYDFNSSQIRRLPPLITKVTGGIVIYSGRNPSLLGLQYHFKPEQGREQNGVLLKTKVKWILYSDKSRKIWLQEVIYNAPAPDTGLKIHFALIATSDKELKELLKIAESMQLKTIGQ